MRFNIAAWRDLDIALLDALEPFGFGHVFPRGTLREPPAGLRGAQVVALARGELLPPDERDRIRKQVESWSPQALWLETTHAPRMLRAADGSEAPWTRCKGSRWRPSAALATRPASATPWKRVVIRWLPGASFPTITTTRRPTSRRSRPGHSGWTSRPSSALVRTSSSSAGSTLRARSRFGRVDLSGISRRPGRIRTPAGCGAREELEVRSTRRAGGNNRRGGTPEF